MIRRLPQTENRGTAQLWGEFCKLYDGGKGNGQLRKNDDKDRREATSTRTWSRQNSIPTSMRSILAAQIWLMLVLRLDTREQSSYWISTTEGRLEPQRKPMTGAWEILYIGHMTWLPSNHIQTTVDIVRKLRSHTWPKVQPHRRWM